MDKWVIYSIIHSQLECKSRENPLIKAVLLSHKTKMQEEKMTGEKRSDKKKTRKGRGREENGDK